VVGCGVCGDESLGSSAIELGMQKKCEIKVLYMYKQR
jgi:hypothetical protein